MIYMEVQQIEEKLKTALKPSRYRHTLGVAYTASCMAMVFGVDVHKAYRAGLLHDCAKCLTNEKRIFLCKKHNIQMNEAELKNPQLLHAKVGSFLAMEEFDIHDQDIINAILNHTTGRPDMSLLEKIIYIADYMEPGRKQAPNLSAIRKAAFEDLDKALLMILEDTLSYLHSTGSVVDTMTQKTYDFYSQYS